MSPDERFMTEALMLAQEAAADGEVPVGAVVVRDGVIVGRGRNRRERDKNALAHAEIEAIGQACRTLGGWRLSGPLVSSMMAMGSASRSRTRVSISMVF